MKIEDVLNQVGQEILSEDNKKLLSEAFGEAVDAKVKEVVELETTNALQKLDESHATDLEKLLEAIDADHTDKLKAVIEKVDADHTGKLQFVIEKYKRVISEDAKAFKGELVEQISNYLDLYVEEKLPRQEIQEAVQNVQARNILQRIKEVVSVDQEFIDSTIQEAVRDGKQAIVGLREELNEAVKTNIRLNQENKATTANLLIEQSTVGFTRDKKEFIMRNLESKDPDFIKENFDYIVKMFEKGEDAQAQILTEEAKSKSTVVTEKVDTPASKIKSDDLINESMGDAPVNGYLNVLESQDKYKK